MIKLRLSIHSIWFSPVALVTCVPTTRMNENNQDMCRGYLHKSYSTSNTTSQCDYSILLHHSGLLSSGWRYGNLFHWFSCRFCCPHRCLLIPMPFDMVTSDNTSTIITYKYNLNLITISIMLDNTITDTSYHVDTCLGRLGDLLLRSFHLYQFLSHRTALSKWKNITFCTNRNSCELYTVSKYIFFVLYW